MALLSYPYNTITDLFPLLETLVDFRVGRKNLARHLDRPHTHQVFLGRVIRVDNAYRRDRLVYGLWGWFRRGWGLDYG